ncbi:MAG: hypothetical protein IAB16_06960 [Firmicutes bacterium]|uniref:DUF5050 domain-containing protein n=1 Tax=Candidatus Stercoripulliclostridium pullicola TaxID=2840953 RepID=A0A940DJ92_9FIRM|nr:hypothetical protein [Candidatus Stercoripulliclostridium pullicola]
MKKKAIFAVIGVILCAALCLALAGCNKKYKQDAVATDRSGIENVVSNGGLAVKAGKYLYFINGYAGQDGDNEFGNVVKGAIMRVELDEAGLPKTDTLATIVPKNVYNTNADIGIVIVGDHIYYTTPSTDKDGSGNAKTSEMVLMRTTLDGAESEVIANFDDYTPVYRVSDGYIVYMNSENELHVIDLNDKKFKDSLVDEEVVAYTFADYADNANGMQNTVFYTKAAENSYATNNTVWAYRAGGAPVKVIDGLASYDANKLAHPGGYSITILDSYFVGGEGIRLVYTKTDSGTNTKSKGVYAYDFNADLTFSEAKEVRYTTGVTYTSLKFIDADNILAADSDSVDYLRKDASGAWVADAVIEGSSLSILDVQVKEGTVTVYYTASNALYKIDVLTANGNGGYDLKRVSAVSLYGTTYNTTWLKLDKVLDCVYFFNSDVKDNAYYLALGKVEPHNSNSQIALQLGKFSNADNIGMLESTDDEEEE